MTRSLVAGLFTLKHLHNLSDEALCERWVENSDFQYVCVEVVLQHGAPFDRSSLTRWRQRLGEIAALSQQSRSVAHRTGAIESKDPESVVEDTTFQEKVIAHPTEARLTHAPGQARGHRGGRAIRLPTSSRAPGMSSNSCAPGSAASSGTSARSRAIPLSRSAARSRAAGPPPRAASARIEGALAARARAGVHRQRQGPRPTPVRLQGIDRYASHRAQRRAVRAAKACTATPTTAIRLVPLSLISKGSQVPPCAASMATRAIAVTTIQRLKVGIRDQAAGSPKPSVANAPSAAVEPAIGHLNDDRRMRISKAEVATRRARCRRLQLRPASAWSEEFLLRVLLWILCRSLPPLGDAQGWQNEPNSVRANPVWALGSIAPIANRNRLS